MNISERTYADGNQYEVLDLVSYSCPSCRMVTWHARKTNQEILCPFCSDSLPSYVTKVSAERMVADSETSWYNARLENGMSPFVVEFFTVQGAGFRCMAYRNGDGKWREAFNDRELSGVVRVLD